MQAFHQPSNLLELTEGVFCTVTVRGCCRERGLKKGFLTSVVMVVLVSLLVTVIMMTSCMKCETGRRLLPLYSGSGRLPKHAFLTSLPFWFLILRRTASRSSLTQLTTVYSHCLERKDMKRVLSFSLKKLVTNLLVWFQLAFPQICCLRLFSSAP